MIRIGSAARLVTGFVLLALAAAWAMPAAAQTGTLKVGVIGPFKLTPGRDIQEAATFAADEINAAGGVLGRKIELVFAETEQNPEKGKTAVERLLFVDKVDVVIGEHRSEVALAVQPILMENKKIFLSTGTASPLLSENVLKDYDKYKYYFRTFLNSNQMAEHMLKQVADMMAVYKKEKVAIITESAVWTEPIVDAFKRALGPKLVVLEHVSTNARDLSVELSKVAAANADILVAILAADAGLPFARQWADRQIPAIVTGYTVMAQSDRFWEQTEGRAQGFMTWKHGVRAPISPKTIGYWDAYTKKFGHVPGAYTNFATYDGVYVLAEAIKRAGNLSSDDLVKALEATDYVGVSGRIKFSKRHDPEAGPEFVPFTYIQWNKGEMVTVWPPAMKTGELTMPPWIK
ncbi:MAG TPA: ABC transporter substrate-binding protein [Xanthobacteraceae bacterium]|jgi:branched-chain amino acid transport system substrate-binding protein